MISLIRLKCNFLDGMEFLLSQCINLLCEHCFWRFCRVNAGSLDTYDKLTSILNELGSIQTQNSSLIGLSNICKDDINHRHQHSILLWMSGIFDDGDNISPLLGHVHQISARSFREFDGVYSSGRTDQIGDVGNSGTRCSSEIEDL